MAYVSVNVFTVRPATLSAFIALNRDAFLPLLQQHPGFLAFEIAQTGADTGVATLWWASEESRQAASPALNAWVAEHLNPFFLSVDNPSGIVVLSSRGD